MTSPGGNIVEIRVVSHDLTGPGFDSATRRAKGLAQAVSGGPNSAGAALQDAERKAGGFAGSLKRVGEIAGGVLVAGMVQSMAQRARQFIGSTVQAASALGESVNAVGKTFGTSSGQVLKWGEQNATSFGLSQRAFNQMATPMGAMLKNQGLSLNEVTEHTIRLTKRAADMGSVFDEDVGPVLQAIQAGLRGEIDPLERFGVSLSAAAVEQRALADSGKTAAKELTAQEKALARLNIIYDQTADTEGDFQQTSDGLANSTRQMNAEIEKAQASVGKTFIPIFAKGAQVTRHMAETFGDLPAPIQATAAAVLGLGTVTALFAPKALAAKAALDAMAASGSRSQVVFARTAKAAGVATAALAGLQIAGAVAASIRGDLNPQVEALGASLENFARTGKFSGEAARLFGADVDTLQGAFKDALDSGVFSDTARAMGEFGDSIGIGSFFDNSLARSRERIDAIDQALATMVTQGRTAEAAAIFTALAGEANKVGVSITELRNGLPAYSAAMGVGAGKTADLGTAARDATPQVEDLDTAIRNINDEAFGLETAQDNAADAVARLKEQVRQQREEHVKGAGSLKGNTQAARDNREAMRDLVEKYEALMTKTEEAGGSTEGMSDKLEDQLVKLGLDRQEAHRYVAQLEALRTKMSQIKSKSVEVEVKVRYHEQRQVNTRGPDEFAHGGISGIRAGRAAVGGIRSARTIVGEFGPEFVDLPFGSTVHTAASTRAMLASVSQGAQEVRWTVMPGGSGEFETFMARWIKRYVRIEGAGSVQAAFGR